MPLAFATARIASAAWSTAAAAAAATAAALSGLRCSASPRPFSSSALLNSLHCRRLTATSAAARMQAEPDEEEDPAIRLKKRAMRKDIRSQLSLLTDEQIMEESRLVWNRIKVLPEYQRAQSVAAFLSMPRGEIRTDDIIEDAVRQGKRIYVPQICSNNGNDKHEGDFHMEMLEVPREQLVPGGALFFDSWPRNHWQIPEPPEAHTFKVAKPGDINFFVVPGLAFDRRGNRLGQGKGYYDRYFRRMNVRGQGRLGHVGSGDAATTVGPTQPYLAAVGLRCQLVEEDVPVSSTDQPMDSIATPDELLVFGKNDLGRV
jgi:5-formyltetrahydrofolate cyclo-ligase